MTETRKKILAMQWTFAKLQLENAKSRESLLRKKIAELFFPSPRPGVNRVELDAERDLKLTAKRNIKFTFDQDKMNALSVAILPYANQCPQAYNIFKQVWQFDEAVYNSCSDEVRQLIDASGLIEIKDTMPQFEIASKPKAGYIG